MMRVKILSCLLLSLNCVVQPAPVVIKESTPDSESVIAVSSSDPEIERLLISQLPSFFESQIPDVRKITADVLGGSFSVAAPGIASAGSGRSFVSASNLSPFQLPMFFMPLNFGHLGKINDWVRNVEGDVGNNSDGEVRTVTAINDNGHVYGNIKTIKFDNKSRSDTKA